MKMRLRLSTIVVVILLISFAPLALAQGGGERALETLAASSKIIESDLVLEDFLAGSQTTRVIVTLKEPTGFQQSIEMDMNRTSQLRTAQQSHEDGHIKDPVFRGRLERKVEEAQDAVVRSLDPSRVRIANRFKYIFGFSAEVTLEGLKEIEALNEVTSISKDGINQADLAQGIPLMNATTVRSTYDGSGMAIAICDTGIDTSHPALGGGGSPIFNSKVIGGYDTGDGDADPRPTATGSAHGTACAGISAGDLGTVGDYIGGVAYNAKLYALKISLGDTGSAYTSDIIEAWEWCVTHQNDDPDNPIMIISTSFGGGYYTSACDSAESALTTAAANAVAAGITLFASTGNDGFCNGIKRSACVSYVNAVGAVYDANIGEYPPPGFVGCISALSCVGNPAPPCSEKWYKDATTAADQVTTYSNSATFMDLFAPSNNAYTTDIVGSGGYASGDYTSSFGGTSAACPYAAGAAASLQSAAKAMTGSFLTPARVRELLTSTGDQVTDPKAPTVTKPRINLQAAVDCITCPPPPPPPPRVVVLEEDFETWPPAGWTIFDNGGDCVWDSNVIIGRTNYTGGSGNCAIADSDTCGELTTMDTELRSPVIDLSGVANALLEFKTDYDYYASDVATVDISTNGGSTWTNLLTWSEDHWGPLTVQIDLTPYVGSATVIIRFHYVGAYDWWWEIDDVVITGVAPDTSSGFLSALWLLLFGP